MLRSPFMSLQALSFLISRRRPLANEKRDSAAFLERLGGRAVERRAGYKWMHCGSARRESS